jgi:hypothetical protein
MTTYAIDPQVADRPISELEELLTPSMIKALRQCGAKTIGKAHTALTSGRFSKVPGMGAVAKRKLADAIAFKEEMQQSNDRMASLARAALAELNLGRELRDFEGVSRQEKSGIADPIDWDREWGGAASDRQREAYRLAQHAPAMRAALLFYAGWGVLGPVYDDAVREDGGDRARAVLAALDKDA